MKRPGINRKLSVKHSILLAILILYLSVLMMSFYKGKMLHIQPGFDICKNDCTQYDNLSNYILKNKKLYPAYYTTYHSSYFFMGYALLVAAIKGLFGNHWKIAYTLLNGLSIYILALFSSRVFLRKKNYFIVFLVSMFFILSNRYLNIYSRTLLPDYIFAIGAGLTFILLVSGIAKGKREHTIGALLIATILLFIKPNGVFLVAFSLVLFLSQFLPKRLPRVIILAAPCIVGLVIFVLSSSLTAYMVKNFDKLNSYPKLPQKIFSQVLEINYLGDNLIHHDHIGTGIVGFPYKYWIHNDGSLTAIMGSVLRRVPRVFEIPIPVYDDVHNYVRYVYYGTLYFFFLAYLVHSIRVSAREPEYLMMASLILGYLISFVSISHIELRYLLIFDVCIILCSSFMVYKITTFLLSQRKKMNAGKAL
jgi:hypothetical protein